MTDPHTQNLSEISHLFLSGVREHAGNGAARPTRIPPPRQNISIDMTPEEFAAAQQGEPAATAKDSSKIGPVTALIAAHLGETLHTQVKSYARHLAAKYNQRIGIIEIDASLFRLHTVERSLGSSADESVEPAEFEAHQLGEALDEMSWDIDRWLLLLPAPRTPEARALLRTCSDWTLLSTADHDGMVAAYRSLKGLSDGAAKRPHLSLAILDTNLAEAQRIHHKLAGVCTQFLHWPVTDFSPVSDPPANVSAHSILVWNPTHDKAQVAAGQHWKVATRFLQRAPAPVALVDDAPTLTQAESDFVAESSAATPTPIPMPQPTLRPALPPVDSAVSEIIDLPDSDPSNILPAILQQFTGELVECPVRAPMCPEARLAITRDRRILLLAVARQGLPDLRAIGQAYRWLIENRALISMAVPQFSIDPHQHPAIRLIINQADLAADILQPLLQSSSVSVQSYRTLRWGQKTGLLLEAA